MPTPKHGSLTPWLFMSTLLSLSRPSGFNSSRISFAVIRAPAANRSLIFRFDVMINFRASFRVKISCSLSRASERGLQLSLLGKSLRGLGGKSIQTQRVGVTKTVGHAPGLYGVRRQAKRDAALA